MLSPKLMRCILQVQYLTAALHKTATTLLEQSIIVRKLLTMFAEKVTLAEEGSDADLLVCHAFRDRAQKNTRTKEGMYAYTGVSVSL